MRRRVISSAGRSPEPRLLIRRERVRLSAGGKKLASALVLAALLTPLLAARRPAGPPLDYSRYHNYAELTAGLQQLAQSHADIAKLLSIGESRGGRKIWALEIARTSGTPVAERPALLITANLEGDQLIGSELALFTADWLLTQYASNPDVKQRVDEQAFLIVPRVNPDAAEAMFASPRADRRANLRPVDDDNDGRMDEDPPEDLNGDGVIAVMRVRDPSGPYRVSSSDPRLMVRADAAKGESGGWKLYIEGTDNDGDGFYNEDGPGGVDLNRNFQHEYPYYATDAGPHMVSEPESRALMEYVLSRPGIEAMLTYGGSDNLITAPNARGELAAAATVALTDFAVASNDTARSIGMMSTGGGFGFGRGGGGGGGRGGSGTAAGTTGGRPNTSRRAATTVNSSDLEYFRTVAEKYRSLTGIARAAVTREPAGAFFEYGYYQYGVPSFSTPGWGIEVTAARDSAAPAAAGDTAAAAVPPAASAADERPAGQRAGAGGQRAGGGPPGAGGGAGAARGFGGGQGAQTPGGSGAASSSDDNDVRLVKWLDEQEIDGFASWTPFRHPQLGDVEIGGFKPYVLSNPPAAEIAGLGTPHAEFALYLAGLFPHVRIASTTVTNHGGGVFRIQAEVENTGFLPTTMAQGVTARSVPPVMVQLEVAPEDIITGANKTSFINALAGSGTRQKYEWVIRVQPGERVELRLHSPKSGSESVTLNLR